MRIRRLILVLFIFVMSVGFFTGGLYYAVSKFLTVNNITVCGSSMYTADDIKSVSGLKDDGSNNMIFVSFGRIKKNLRTELPFIKDVRVYRSFPDTIVIEVLPDEPFAQISNETGRYLVDEDLKILKRDDNEYDYLAVTAQIDESQDIGKTLKFESDKSAEIFRNIMSQCEKNELLDKMNTVRIDDIYDIYMIYDNRIQISFGDYSEINSKIQFAANIIGMRPETDKGIADVRSTEEARFRLTRS